MIDIKVYREYWEGVQKRIPEIKKVLPFTLGIVLAHKENNA